MRDDPCERKRITSFSSGELRPDTEGIYWGAPVPSGGVAIFLNVDGRWTIHFGALQTSQCCFSVPSTWFFINTHAVMVESVDTLV